MLSNETRVTGASPESISIRTTIPLFVAKQIGLNVGDTLEWSLDKDGEKWIVYLVRKD